jgi:urease accessory protein
MRILSARPAVVVDALPANVDPADLQGKEADRLLLTWEQRRWLRGRFSTEGGREIGVALPTGTYVEPGRTLWVDTEWYLTMDAANEPLLALRPGDQQQAILVAFEVGNLHFPLALDADRLLVPDDAAMVQLFDRMGISWEKYRAPFRPIGKGTPHGR